MSITVKGDYDEYKRELHRLRGLVDSKSKKELDLALAIIYTDIKSRIHVETKSLKNSARKNSRSKGPVYEGTVTIGGATKVPSVHDPVVYAHYERNRGGTHDFLREFESYHALFGQVVEDVLRG